MVALFFTSHQQFIFMLPLFEEHTCDISRADYQLLPVLVTYLEGLYPETKTIKQMCDAEELSAIGLNVDKAKRMISFLRRFRPDPTKPAGIMIRCNYDNQLRLICSKGSGYFLSNNASDWEKQLHSFTARTLGTYQNAFQFIERMPSDEHHDMARKMVVIKKNLLEIIDQIKNK